MNNQGFLHVVMRTKEFQPHGERAGIGESLEAKVSYQNLVRSKECGGFMTGCERLHLVSLIQDASELAVL